MFTPSLYRVHHILFKCLQNAQQINCKQRKMSRLKTIKSTLITTSIFLNNIKWMLTRYSTSLYVVIGVHVVTV